MRIQSSNIELYGRSKSEEHLRIQQEIIKDDNQAIAGRGQRPDLAIDHNAPIMEFFDIDIEKKNDFIGRAERVESHEIYEISEEDYQKVKMLEKILSYLTGKEVKFILPKRLQVNGKDGQVTHLHNGRQVESVDNQPFYRRRVEYKREQSMDFRASGVVKTADGREINFDLKLQRSEKIQFREEMTLNRQGKVVDPLVINYNGNLTGLTRQKYAFDLDFDGAGDQISFLEKGSGYLAFDRNQNGKIDDGRELFGPQSGDGFRDFAVHDEDGNGFIDEGDSIFNKLRIWNKDENGNDVLFGLGEVGIGAIYLGNVATDYALGNGPMAEDGFIRSTGIFLREDGSTGTVHHVDLGL